MNASIQKAKALGYDFMLISGMFAMGITALVLGCAVPILIMKALTSAVCN